MKNLRSLLLGIATLWSALSFAGSVAELERIASQATTLDEFLGSTIVKEQYFNALKKYQHRDRFRCESFDKIIAKVKTLSEKVPGFSKAIWETSKPTNVEVVAYRPVDEKKGSPFIPDRYVFRGVPRKFHAIWNDPSLTGCYSDACNEDDTNLPDRWSVATQGAELYYVEKNGIFTDQSVLFVPIKRQDKDYRLIVVGGGPALLKEIDIWNGGTKKSFRQSLAQTVAQRLQKSRWKDNRVELLINKSERKIASTDGDKKAVPPTPVEEFSVGDKLGSAIEKTMPRKCLGETKGELAAALGKKFGSDDKLQKFPLNSTLNPAFNDTKAVAEMLKDGTLANKLVDASTLSGADRDTVDTQLTKIFMDTAQDPSLRSRAGLALNQFNRPDVSKNLLDRSNPYRPVGMNTKDVKPEVANAFLKNLNDPSAPVRAAAALGAIDSQRPIPDKALANLENSFKPTQARDIASSNPNLLPDMIAAADRAGIFSPPLDKNINNAPSDLKLPELENLAKAIDKGERFPFDRIPSVEREAVRNINNPDFRRRFVEVMAREMDNAPPGGSRAGVFKMLQDQNLDPRVRESLYDSIKSINKFCGKEAFWKNKLQSPPAEDVTFIRFLERLYDRAIPSAFATPVGGHVGGDTKEGNSLTGDTVLWQCHEDGSPPSMIQRQLGKAQVYFVNSVYEEGTGAEKGKWKSVPKDTPNSECRWFVVDDKGTFDRGAIGAGSVMTGALLGKTDPDDVDNRFLYVPPDLINDPSVPSGWVKLCPGEPDFGDTIGFIRGYKDGVPLPFDRKNDWMTLNELLRVKKEPLLTFAQAKLDSIKHRQELENGVVDPTQCSRRTGKSIQMRTCTFGPKEKKYWEDLGSKACTEYPNATQNSLATEQYDN